MIFIGRKPELAYLDRFARSRNGPPAINSVIAVALTPLFHSTPI
jgi:hypothetical protein